jgi:hypothetical protein
MDSTRLSMRWIPVTDASGRSHLEAVWITEDSEAPAANHATTQAA